MSYPNKEKQVDKQPDNIESLQQQTANQTESSLQESKAEPCLPVGKLKWSKEDEEEQDTHLSLTTDKKEKDEMEDQPDSQEQADDLKPSETDVPPASSVTEKTSLPDVEDAQKPSSEPEAKTPSGSNEPLSSQLSKRNLSIEDTLTPIDFKEYSLDPNFQEKAKEQKEFETELKKPAFLVEPEPAVKQAKRVKTEISGQDDAEEIKGSDRAFPKIIKVLWLPATLVVVLFVGLIVGHTVIGGQPASDIFDLSMWEHIYALIFKK